MAIRSSNGKLLGAEPFGLQEQRTNLMGRKQEKSPPPEAVSRRSFLVMLGGSALGSFLLPDLPGAAAASFPGPAPPAGAVLQAPVVRRLLGWPAKSEQGDGSFFLTWFEETASGNQVMIWSPQTEAERAEAQRFYEASRGMEAGGGTPGPDCNRPLPERGARERALIRAILDRPEDDAPWLAYADWLASRGDSHGEFVRLSCLKKRTGGTHPRTKDLEKRCRELIERDAEKWFAPLSAIGLRPAILGRFRPDLWLSPRGLIEEIEIYRPGVLPEQADRLFAAAPVLHRIRFAYNGVNVHGLAEVPQLEQVTYLRLLGQKIDFDKLYALAFSPHLCRLKELDLSYNPLGPEGGRLLAASPLLPRLQTLTLHGCALGREGVTALLAAPPAAPLVGLDLEDNNLDVEAVRALAVAAHLKQLRSLKLGSNPLGIEAVRVLQTAPFLGSLTALDLDACDLDVEAMRLLAGWPLGELTWLSLAHNPIGPDGARALAAAAHLKRLRTLYLYGAGLGDEGAQALAASPGLATVTELSLGRDHIGPSGVRALAGSPHLRKLTGLQLWDNPCGSEGAAALAASPYLTELRELDLHGHAIGPEGARALANAPSLKRLERLTVSRASVGPADQNALVERFGDGVVIWKD
jgi:uncharacterized protein (TIGR02996 family)